MDYLPVLEELTFLAGELSESEHCFTVEILEDNVIESPESFQLLLVLNETFRGSGDKNITILDSKIDYSTFLNNCPLSIIVLSIIGLL